MHKVLRAPIERLFGIRGSYNACAKPCRTFSNNVQIDTAYSGRAPTTGHALFDDRYDEPDMCGPLSFSLAALVNTRSSIHGLGLAPSTTTS